MRSILASVLVATAFRASSAQTFNAFGPKGAVIEVTDGCGAPWDVNVTRSSDSGGRKRAQGVWVDSFDDKAKGRYTLAEGSSTVQGTVRTGYSAIVTNPRLKYGTVVQEATNGDYAYSYKYCSGDPADDSNKLALEDVESLDLTCEVTDDISGFYEFTVENTMDSTLTGLKVQVTFDPPIDYKTVLGPAGVSVRAPRSKKNTLGTFRPAIKSTSLRVGGFHIFSITSPDVDYAGKVTIRATASGGKVCVTELDRTGTGAAITTRNGVRVDPEVIEAVPAQNP